MRPADGCIRHRRIHLLFNQRMDAIAQADHAFHALRGGCIQLRPDHTTVLPVIHLTVHKGIAVILHIGVGGNRGVDFLAFTQVWQLRFGIGASDILYCVMELIGELQPFNGIKREILPTILCAFCAGTAKHHFWMLHKIAVDGKTVLIGAEVYPFRLDLNRPVPFLQEDDVRDNIRPGISAERIVGQTDCAEKLRPLCNVFAYLRGLLVHGVATRHKGDHAARTHLIQRLCKEIIVD